MAVREEYMALDGQDLKWMVKAALVRLRQHKEAINALNVFPVPDGDTGTNMMLTMTSAWEEIENLPQEEVGVIAEKVAHGALMGARGNSGVILSQIWRGLARGLAGKTRVNVPELTTALQAASDTAYKGVVKPVEGTILTVIRETAAEMELVAKDETDMREFFKQLVSAAKASESRTPSLLAVLREAGVVDAGGQGLAVIFEGMWHSVAGIAVTEDERLLQVVDLSTAGQLDVDHGHEHIHFDRAYPYDVQFIVRGQDMDVTSIRAGIEALGDCPLIVGDSQTIKVHVHVSDPGIPISYGVRHGELLDVVVENMQAQYLEFLAGRDVHPGRGPGKELISPLIANLAPDEMGVVVVAAGEGMVQIFQSLGAVVVRGGQTMNPSTADIVKALDQLPTEQAIVLPNNKNIFMASEQAAEVSEKTVAVVPTRSMAQGVGALLFLNPQATLDENVTAMGEAAQEIISGEVTWAVRSVTVNGVKVRKGDAIGLLDGKMVVAGETVEGIVRELLGLAELEERELVTFYYGEDVLAEEAESLIELLRAAYLELEFEVMFGGQPHYPYLISIE
ncbi:MAG TPA: DAK2 domain-containing protein [Thermoflexia bacterium]|nr:DAK2 domain-containing protein [Thermoflexia bacterium]